MEKFHAIETYIAQQGVSPEELVQYLISHHKVDIHKLDEATKNRLKNLNPNESIH